MSDTKFAKRVRRGRWYFHSVLSLQERQNCSGLCCQSSLCYDEL